MFFAEPGYSRFGDSLSWRVADESRATVVGCPFVLPISRALAMATAAMDCLPPPGTEKSLVEYWREWSRRCGPPARLFTAFGAWDVILDGDV